MNVQAHFKAEETDVWNSLLTDKFVRDGLPRGTEGTLDMTRLDRGWFVHGSLRDMSDYDAPGVLAWFIEKCGYADTADLRITVDDGPRYRYEWDKTGLRKLRGILD